MSISWIFLVCQITSKKFYHFCHSRNFLFAFYFHPFLLIANIAFHCLTSLSKVSPIPHPDNSKRSLIGFPDLKGTIFNCLTLYYVFEGGKPCNFAWKRVAVHINKMFKIFFFILLLINRQYSLKNSEIVRTAMLRTTKQKSCFVFLFFKKQSTQEHIRAIHW